jgi:hypothetical protein
MNDKIINKIVEIVRKLNEDGGMSVGAVAPTNSTNKSGGPISIAGLPPDNPPVDLRKKKTKYWNPFFKDLARIQRRNPPNG